MSLATKLAARPSKCIISQEAPHLSVLEAITTVRMTIATDRTTTRQPSRSPSELRMMMKRRRSKKNRPLPAVAPTRLLQAVPPAPYQVTTWTTSPRRSTCSETRWAAHQSESELPQVVHQASLSDEWQKAGRLHENAFEPTESSYLSAKMPLLSLWSMTKRYYGDETQYVVHCWFALAFRLLHLNYLYSSNKALNI